MYVFTHVPVHSCSNSSKTWSKVGCCGIWALAQVFMVQAVHAEQSKDNGCSYTCVYFPYVLSKNTDYSLDIFASGMDTA